MVNKPSNVFEERRLFSEDVPENMDGSLGKVKRGGRFDRKKAGVASSSNFRRLVPPIVKL
jgi:hypothetical protein